jgi:DNA repair protein RadC
MPATDRPLAAIFTPIARGARETVAFAFLDRAGRVLGLRHCASGRLEKVYVPVRVVAGDAISLGAHMVVMAHNHPSGDAEPSRDDVSATRRIGRALDALGVRLVDHLVLAGDAVTSLRARGLL